MPKPSILGERMLLERRRHDMSQQDLAEHIGIAAHTVGQLERGAVQKVYSDVLVKAARTFGCTTDYLLGLDLKDGEVPTVRLVDIF
jgi:transcriptional regulator with XRE-family HTH domain